jgi:hypothetical protein
VLMSVAHHRQNPIESKRTMFVHYLVYSFLQKSCPRHYPACSGSDILLTLCSTNMEVSPVCMPVQREVCVASHTGNKGRYFSVRIANIVYVVCVAYVALCVVTPLVMISGTTYLKKYSISRVNTKFILLPLILNNTNCATSH